MSVDHYFLSGKFAFLANMDLVLMVIGIILCGVGIFVACSLIDWIRELLFRKLKVKSRLAGLEEKIYLKFDNYLE
jgi:TM2 domain-containing membrane protein YozV